MRIKRLLLMALCVVLMGFALTACSEEEIGAYLEEYENKGIGKPVVVEDVVLDLYIIYEEASANAMTTVQDNINLYIDDIYNTTLNIHYLTEEEYATKILGDGTNPAVTSGIVLINGESLMNSLVTKNALVDLLPYLTNTKDYKFGTLNNQITASLLEQAKTKVEGQADKLYCIPNNHVVGSYDYVKIDKDLALKLKYSIPELTSMNTMEKAADLIANANAHLTPEEAAAVVTFVPAEPYEYKAQAEADGYICNVASYPTVTTAEAYSSAFAILAGTAKADRAMQIIYAINTDAKLRNLLQYGVENTNYKMVNGIVVPETDSDTVTYKMNLLYTGDVFMANYCETEGWVKWNSEIKANGKAQNEASVPAN